jgi:hypothetical protein
MTRTRRAALLTLYAAIAVLAAIFLRAQVAPCFGLIPTGQMNPDCVAAWQVSRPMWDTMFDTPIGGLVVFGVLTAGTWLLVRVGGRPASTRGTEG